MLKRFSVKDFLHNKYVLLPVSVLALLWCIVKHFRGQSLYLIIFLIFFVYYCIGKYKKKLVYWFVYGVTAFYDTLLFHKGIRKFYHFCWFLAFFFFICFQMYFKAALVAVIFLVWKRFFVFPFKKKNIFNTVMGPPGSGKTTFCAFIAKWAASVGEPCYANVDIKGTYEFSWAKDFGNYMIEDATIIIDEAALEEGMNNRDFKKNFAGDAGKQKLDTSKKHRHFGLDIWMLSQADDTDIKLRELTQNYYVLRKLPVPWLMKIRMYDTDIDLDPMTQDFRKVRIKKRTYFLFTPVVWLSFDTHERDQLPRKKFRLR